MAKKKHDLTKQELEAIKQRESIVESLLGAINQVTKFKKGDFLIAFHPQTHYRKRSQMLNSYGAPKKFVVVHTDKYDIPYMKEINKKGTPVGYLIGSVKFENGHTIVKNNEYDFEVDPDYTDSIIMMDEDNYDSSAVHREKSDTFKAITDHNKQHKVNCNEEKELANWFETNVKVGDVLWKSIMTSYSVLEIKPVPKDKAGRRDYHYPFIKVMTNKGKTLEMRIYDFKWTALYTQRPRSYNELKDPK